jgi:hypothetical protein
MCGHAPITPSAGLRVKRAARIVSRAKTSSGADIPDGRISRPD